MKGKRNWLIGILFGALSGWGLATFCLPLLIENFSFLLGFITAFLFISLGLFCLFFWKKRRTEKSDHNTSLDTSNWTLVFLMVILGAFISSFFLVKQNAFLHDELMTQDQRMVEQSILLEASRKGNLVFLMSNILTKVDDELKHHPTKMLSDETISRIAALSHSFQPYQYLEGDTLSTEKWSPERGQLLLALSTTTMDSSSFNKIKLKASFAGADLGAANLRGINLANVNLAGANLKEADLRATNLSNANLSEANLWNANLRGANLNNVNFYRADLRWADFTTAQLKGANFSGADLTSAKMSHLDFSGVNLKWVNLTDAFLNGATLVGADLTGTLLIRANLSQADFTEASLRLTELKQANLRMANLTKTNLISADLTEADLMGANFSEADLYKATIKEANWFEKSVEWKIKGVDQLKEKYKIEKDLSGMSDYWFLPIKK